MNTLAHTASDSKFILDSLLDGVIIVDTHGHVLYANHSADKLFGVEDRRLVGETFGYSITAGEVQEIHVYREGQVYFIELLASPIAWNGSPALLMSLRDITETVTLNKSLRAASRESKLKDDFIAVASHELRTPLTCIKAYGDLMLEETSGQASPLADYTLRQNKFIGKLSRLINDILDVSRIRSGKLQLTMVEFCFEAFLRECIDLLTPISDSHKLVVEGHSDTIILGDRERLEQVITNLVSNAVKYSPGKDKILIRLKDDKGWLKVSFIDFGIGISPSQMRIIFSRFYRATKVNSKFEGLGLGLFIASEIIKQHGGKIEVRSKEEQGSTFTIWLPGKKCMGKEKTTSVQRRT